MSIIYDALKKVEASSTDDTKTKTDKFTRPKPKPYLLYALIICLFLFTANVFYGWLSQKHPLKTADIAIKAQLPSDKKETVSLPPPSAKIVSLQAKAPAESRIESPKETPPSLTLNGVFFSGPEGYALINNQIVKKGDKIDGATVVEIYLDEVDLQRDGSIIKLSNSAK